MGINKSEGTTQTERLLAGLCDRTFLRLWSYPNPYKDDGDELCDLIAIFDDHIFVFFDREKTLPELTGGNAQVNWDRWKRRVVDKQVKTAHGAERYLRSRRRVYLDPKRTVPFPLPLNVAEAVIHKIVVAHGAANACAAHSDANVSGSLAIKYCDEESESLSPSLSRWTVTTQSMYWIVTPCH